MQFDSIEWDEKKRISNTEKHGLDFLDVVHVFDGPCLLATANTVGGESRSLAIGMLDDVCVVVIFTLRGTTLRVISMRKARQNERKQYDEKILSG